MCYWRSYDFYFSSRTKTSFSESWTNSSCGCWACTFRCKQLLMAPFMLMFLRSWMKDAQTRVSQCTAAASRHPRLPCVVFVWQSTSQFLKSHMFSLGIHKPVACIPTHTALSCWHGRRTKSLDCKLCVISSLWEAEEKMLPVMNSTQIKRISSQHSTHY